jgi:Domain of unknown function (DUF4160)
MPVIIRKNGYKIFFYSNEGDPREPPHIHVRKGSSEAKIWLDPAIAFNESNGFNPRELRDIIKLIADNYALILEAWHDHFGN